jgi:DNA mismatch endonuclease (patch repair protein)
MAEKHSTWAEQSFHKRTPVASSPAVRATMLANRGRNTAPERLLRVALREAGFKFRMYASPTARIRCAADIVFRAQKICIFIDGCFWHGCPRHFTTPQRNGAWWTEKIARTKARDERQRVALKAASWKVIRLWEHQLEGSAADKTVSRLIVRLEGRMHNRVSYTNPETECVDKPSQWRDLKVEASNRFTRGRRTGMNRSR